ncbi:MAG: heme ABC transporter ATP-binding protein [Alphaproteobacteria bacterium]
MASYAIEAEGTVTITLDAVSVRRGRRSVLHEVSLEFQPGEIVALLGPNGAGKSTLLSAIAGDLPVSGGQIVMNGIPLPTLSFSQQAAMRAVMRQSFSLPFAFTVGDVIEMGVLSPTTYPHIVQKVLDLADLSDFADRPVTQLSGGEKQRTSLARALAQVLSSPNEHDPKFLLLDEPTASLDLKHQRAVVEISRQVAQENIGVITVMHDLNLAAAFADRVVVMADGRIKGAGSVEDVVREPLLQSVYDTPLTVFHKNGVPIVLLDAASP